MAFCMHSDDDDDESSTDSSCLFAGKYFKPLTAAFSIILVPDPDNDYDKKVTSW